MQAWWQQLESRERIMVLIGGIITALILYYGVILKPLMDNHEKNVQLIEQRENDLAWMKSAAKQIKANGNSISVDTSRSVLAITDGTAKQFQMKPFIRSVKPEGSTIVNLDVTSAPYTTMMRWLAHMEKQFGLTVMRLRIQNTDNGVDARITLERTDNS